MTVNLAETTKLCKILASLLPAQKFEADTPTVWCGVLDGIQYVDAIEAVTRLARRMPFIGTSEICSEVAAIRKSRVQAADAVDELVPNVDPDDPAAYNAERRALMQAAADGSLDADEYASGGVTLTGTDPWRPRETTAISARPERVRAIIEGRPLRSVPRRDA